jgi:hypothetical protein
MSYADESDPDGRLNGPADLRQRLHQAFKTNGRAIEAERLKRPADRSSYAALMESYRLQLWEAQEVYRQEYQTRVEVRMRELIDRRASKTVEYVHPQGMADRFNARDIRRQAERDVRHDHGKHMARLRNLRDRDLKALLHKARQKQALEGKAKDGFARVADRRTGQERRTADQARASPRQRSRKRD